MNSQFKRGVLELCVLKVISKKKMSAFEVINVIAMDIDVNENTVYPILRRLTNDGLFQIDKENVGVGAPRKYYSLTDLGNEKLLALEDDWLSFISGVNNILGGSVHER